MSVVDHLRPHSTQLYLSILPMKPPLKAVSKERVRHKIANGVTPVHGGDQILGRRLLALAAEGICGRSFVLGEYRALDVVFRVRLPRALPEFAQSHIRPHLSVRLKARSSLSCSRTLFTCEGSAGLADFIGQGDVVCGQVHLPVERIHDKALRGQTG